MIYNLQFGDRTLFYRCPSRTELGLFRSFAKKNYLDFYERLVRTCVIDPIISFDSADKIKQSENPDILYITERPYLPGDILDLGRQIVDQTGFSNSKYLKAHITSSEHYAQSLQGKWDALSLAAIPGIKPKDLWDMAPTDLYKTYVLANIIAANIGIDPRKFTDPEAYMKDVEKAQLDQRMANSMADARNTMHGAMKLGPKSTIQSEGVNTLSVK